MIIRVAHSHVLQTQTVSVAVHAMYCCMYIAVEQTLRDHLEVSVIGRCSLYEECTW